MKQLFRFLLLASAIAAPAKAQQPSSEHARRLNAFINEAFSLSLSPGFGVAIVVDDSVFMVGGFGFADLETNTPVTSTTPFYIASATKSFVGLAAALMHERGDLDLDLPISSYVSADLFHPDVEADSITMRQLLTHTHGIENDGPLTFRYSYSGQNNGVDIANTLASHPPAETGTEFSYGNIGYNTAALVLDLGLGRDWREIVTSEVLLPLGMTQTTTRVSQQPRDRLAMPYSATGAGFDRRHYDKGDDNMHSAGGMITTARDAARWLLANINNGYLDGQQVLPEEAFLNAHSPHAEEAASFMEFTRNGYGLGWHTGEYDGDVLLHHFGGFPGFHSHVSFMPERRIGVAAFANDIILGTFLAEVVARYTYDLLLGKPGIDEKYRKELEGYRENAARLRIRLAAGEEQLATRPRRPHRPLSDFAGGYLNEEYGMLEFVIVGDSLEAVMGPIRSNVTAFEESRADFLRIDLVGRGTVVHFLFGEDGPAHSAKMSGVLYERASSNE